MRSGKPGGRVGIVDVGSNSVRLVVYAAAERSPVRPERPDPRG